AEPRSARGAARGAARAGARGAGGDHGAQPLEPVGVAPAARAPVPESGRGWAALSAGGGGIHLAGAAAGLAAAAGLRARERELWVLSPRGGERALAGALGMDGWARRALVAGPR